MYLKTWNVIKLILYWSCDEDFEEVNLSICSLNLNHNLSSDNEYKYFLADNHFQTPD